MMFIPDMELLLKLTYHIPSMETDLVRIPNKDNDTTSSLVQLRKQMVLEGL